MSHDNFFMQRCLDLAIKGIGKTYPNPLVGCVIVLNNKKENVVGNPRPTMPFTNPASRKLPPITA